MVVNKTQCVLKHEKNFLKDHILTGTKQLNGQDCMEEDVPAQGTLKLAFLKHGSMVSKMKENETLSVWRITYPFLSEPDGYEYLYVLVKNEARSVLISVSDDTFDPVGFLQPVCGFTEIPFANHLVNYPKVEASMSKPLKETPMGQAALSVQAELRITDDLSVLQVWVVVSGGRQCPDLISLDVSPASTSTQEPEDDEESVEGTGDDGVTEGETQDRSTAATETETIDAAVQEQIQELRVFRRALENGEMREELQLLGQAIGQMAVPPQGAMTGRLPGNFTAGDVVVCLTGPHDFGGGRGVAKYDVGTVIGPATQEPQARVRCSFPRDPSTNMHASEISLQRSVGAGFLVGDKVRSLVAQGHWRPNPLNVGDTGNIIAGLANSKIRVDFGHVQGTMFTHEVCKPEQYCHGGFKVKDKVKALAAKTVESVRDGMSVICIGDVGEVIAPVADGSDLVRCKFPNAPSINVLMSNLSRSVADGLFVGDVVKSLVTQEHWTPNPLRTGDIGKITAPAADSRVQVDFGHVTGTMFVSEFAKVEDPSPGTGGSP